MWDKYLPVDIDTIPHRNIMLGRHNDGLQIWLRNIWKVVNYGIAWRGKMIVWEDLHNEVSDEVYSNNCRASTARQLKVLFEFSQPCCPENRLVSFGCNLGRARVYEILLQSILNMEGWSDEARSINRKRTHASRVMTWIRMKMLIFKSTFPFQTNLLSMAFVELTSSMSFEGTYRTLASCPVVNLVSNLIRESLKPRDVICTETEIEFSIRGDSGPWSHYSESHTHYWTLRLRVEMMR